MRKNGSDDYRWLEEELLAVEEEYEEEYGEEDGEEDWLEEARQLSRGRKFTGFSPAVYEDEEFDEDAAVVALTPRQIRKQKKQEKARKKQDRKMAKLEKKRNRIGGLVFLAIMEVLGILVVLGWWIEWLT